MPDEDEQARLQEIASAKRDRLHVLRVQIARFGETHAPAHMLTERAELRAELGMVETVIEAPARIDIGDELGERGRFLLYHEQWRQVQDSVSMLGRRIDEIAEAFRRWLIWVGIVVFVLSLIIVAVVTYLAVRL